MCTGIAPAESELPLDLFERFNLSECLHERGGEREIRFLFRSRNRLLPVWHEGKMRLVRWGCRRGESKALPLSGWALRESLEKGLWSGFSPEGVEIPASMGLENGIWFRIREGVRGILVQNEKSFPVAYVLCEPASHYYKTMTRSGRMPVLVGQTI